MKIQTEPGKELPEMCPSRVPNVSETESLIKEDTMKFAYKKETSEVYLHKIFSGVTYCPCVRKIHRTST
jgi:hypothetical protein